MSAYRIVAHRGALSLAYTDPAKGRVRIALGTNDRSIADTRARQIWLARATPEVDRVADIWSAYVNDKARDSVTIDPSNSTWKVLQPTFGNLMATSITRDLCRTHYNRRRREHRSDSTIRRELEMLRAALRHVLGHGAPAVWMPPPSKPRERYLTRDQMEALLACVTTPHVRLFIILALTTGARMSALLDLTWDRVNLVDGFIDLNPAGRHLTNKRRATVPINGTARLALDEARRASLSEYVIEYGGRPVKSVKKAVSAAARRSGIMCSPHVFRHTAGVWLAQANVPLAKIAQYLGHTSTRVTERHYARFSPSYMLDASEALNL